MRKAIAWVYDQLHTMLLHRHESMPVINRDRGEWYLQCRHCAKRTSGVRLTPDGAVQ